MSNKTFRSNGMISLITDFGLADPYVGVMKAIISSRHPAARVIDLTHAIPAFQMAVAGFWLAHCWRYFPPGTIHLAVVDPGVGTERGMVMLETGGQLFVAPDNGLLEPVSLSATPDDRSWRTFGLADLQDLRLPNPSHTFHGRDIFAPLVAEISAGRLVPGTIGKPFQPSHHETNRPQAVGQIITVDHYGNLLTNLDSNHLQPFNKPAVRFRDLTIPLLTTYGAAQPGQLLALINSWGMLEIAQSQGNAQLLLHAHPGETVALVELP